MVNDFVDSAQWFWIDAVICTLTFIFQTLLFIIHLFVSLHSYNIVSFCKLCVPKTENNNDRKSVLTTIATLSALFFYFIYGTDVFLTRIDSLFGEYLHANILFTCVISCRIGSISYQISKGCIYCVFVLRLKLAFNGSLFQYNNKLLNILLYIIIFYTFSLIILNIFGVNATKQYIQSGVNNKSFYTCNAIIEMYLIAYMVFMDIIFTIICMYLFIKPLKQIITKNKLNNRVKSYSISHLPSSKTNNNVAPPNNNPSINNLASQSITEISSEFREIILKYTIVSTVGLLSTFCGLIIIGITSAPAFSMIDVWINSACLILMSKQYNKFYKILCYCIINCINSKNIINKIKTNRINMKNIEIAVNNNNVKPKANMKTDGDITKDNSDQITPQKDVPVGVFKTVISNSNVNDIIQAFDDDIGHMPKKRSLDINSRSASLMDDYHQQQQT